MITADRTLQDKVRFTWAYSARKHSLAPDPEQLADDEINRLSNSEFLERLSCALEELLSERVVMQ